MQIFLIRIKLFSFSLKYNYYKLKQYWYVLKNKFIQYNTLKYGINLMKELDMLDKMNEVLNQEKGYIIKINGGIIL